MRKPYFFGIHASPPRMLRHLLSITPFILLLLIYIFASESRLESNPQDKLLPSLTQMWDAFYNYAFVDDRRTGRNLFLEDTFSSLKRLLIGIGSAAFVGLMLGLNVALYPGLRSLASSFITSLSMVPPLALLPILFISFGVGEMGKIILIFIGTMPLIARDVYMATIKIPQEKIIKALTLGASNLALTYKIALPLIMPKLISSIRLSLGAAWLFLIAAEAIASTDGLGYRIFLVRRYLSMDLIIPTVLWITALGFIIDYFLAKISRLMYPWHQPDKGE